MKSQKPSNRQKTTQRLKLKDLKTNKDPRAGGVVKPTRPGFDGCPTNHNEVFLGDVS